MSIGCKNCAEEDVSLHKSGYCDKCNYIIKNILNIEKGQIPKSLKDSYVYSKDPVRAKEFYIESLGKNLSLLRDAYAFQEISPHELEYRFSEVSMLAIRKPFPKMNDLIAARLGASERLFVFQLLTIILIEKRSDHMKWVYKRWNQIICE